MATISWSNKFRCSSSFNNLFSDIQKYCNRMETCNIYIWYNYIQWNIWKCFNSKYITDKHWWLFTWIRTCKNLNHDILNKKWTHKCYIVWWWKVLWYLICRKKYISWSYYINGLLVDKRFISQFKKSNYY